MSFTLKTKRSQSAENILLPNNLYFYSSNLNDIHLSLESQKKLKEFNKKCVIENAKLTGQDENKNFERSTKDQNTFLKLKKSLIYKYHYGKEEREKNRMENYQFVSNILDREFEMEDEFTTEQLYNKRLIAEFLTMIFTLISIGSSIVYHELKTYTIYQNHNEEIIQIAILTALNITSISNIFFIICTVKRYLIILELKISIKRKCENEKLFKSKLFIKMMIEIIVCLFHPNIIVMDYTFKSSSFWDMRQVDYHVNDYLIIILLLRSYVILRFFINLSYYYNSRMDRIAKMLGGKVSLEFAIKCMMQDNPKIFLLITVGIWVSVLSFSVKIIEGPLHQIDKDTNDFSLFQNCVWNIFVTMTSVGYGDFYPKTNIGRIFLIFTSISGTILVSLIVNTLQNSVKFDENELRAYEYKERIDLKKLIDKFGWQYFVAGYKYAKTKKLYMFNLSNPKFTKNLKQRLKDKLASLLYDKISAKKNFKNIIHKYRNCYDPITDFDCIKEKLININKFVKENNEKLDVNEKILLDIYELMCRIKKQIYIIADEENKKVTDYKNIKFTYKNSLNYIKMVEEMSFIEEKSFEVFCKINNKNYKREDVSFEITPLNGISNFIYRVQIFHKNKEETFQIPNVFFKIFGKISSLVNREYETIINNSLAEVGYSSKIYDTDNKTYRVDEFLYGFNTLTPSCLYKEEVLNKMITILSYYNTIMDVNTYAHIMSIRDKREYFNILLNDQTNYNCIAYLVRLLKPLANESFIKFKQDVEADKESITQEFKENLNMLEKYLENFDKLMYDFCPDRAIMVVSHNDSHCLNILANKNYTNIMLVDHEYGYFNFLGYDIINYILESMFCLSDDKFPFYQFLIKDFNFLNLESTFEVYLRFLYYFKEKYGHLFTKYHNFDELFEMACTKEYYWKVLCTNCLFILLFAILYFDYPSIKNKSGYDYFQYIVDRMKAFEYASKSINYDLK